MRERSASAGGWLLFDTAFGPCGLAWSDIGLTHVMLPAATPERTREHPRRCVRGAPEVTEGMDALSPGASQGVGALGASSTTDAAPPFARRAIAEIRALLRGEATPLAHLPLDWVGVQDFERRVYEATLLLGPGHTCTYGELARQIGDAGAARAVGVALGRNPWPLVVPCHRVLGAGGLRGGGLVGFSAPGGVQTKQRLLVLEAGMARQEGELF